MATPNHVLDITAVVCIGHKVWDISHQVRGCRTLSAHTKCGDISQTHNDIVHVCMNKRGCMVASLCAAF